MRSTIVKNELVVGTFVAIALLMTTAAIMKRTREKGLLDTQQVHFIVPHGSGLQTGAPVLMKGIQVGSVNDVQLTDDHQVKVTCDIAPRFAQHISKDAKVTVVEPPFIGTTKVEIDPGETKGEVASDQKLETQVKGTFMDRVDEIEQRVSTVVARVDSFVVAANKTLESINNISTKVEKGDGLIPRLINDKKLADDTEAVIKDVRAITKAINEGEGALSLAINDKDFAKDLKATSTDIRKIVKDIQDGKGSLGRLAKDAKLVDESTGLVKDGRAALNKLNSLNDEAKQSMKKVQSLLDTTTKSVAKVEGLLNTANRVTKEMADTLHRINTGKGTIASLLNDPALYKETKSLLKELRESVEDLREQAPINSFIGVVFAAF